MDLLKNKTFWVSLGFLTIIIVALGELAALVFLGSCIGIWYFKKKKPNRTYSFYSICLAVISFFVIGITGVEAEPGKEEIQVANFEEVTSDDSEKESAAIAESIAAKENKARAESKAKEERKKSEAESIKKEEERKKSEAEAKKKAEEEAIAKKAAEVEEQRTKIQTVVPEVPAGNTYVEVNGNVPIFTNEDITSTDAWEKIGTLDSLGRVTTANALLGVELMPAEERGDISDITPTGWNQANYAGIGSGGWLYNRSHMIGHQLTGNDSLENIMTGTRSFNMAMLEFENFIANYIEQTENHVRYRITPVFEGDNQLASGIYMEGFSIEDNGEGVQFHIYIPNVQLDVTIDYADGSSQGPAGPAEEPDEGSLVLPPVTEDVPAEEPVVEEVAPVGGDWTAVDTNGNGKVTIAEAEAAGFVMPLYSDHWLYPYMDDRDGDGMVGE